MKPEFVVITVFRENSHKTPNSRGDHSSCLPDGSKESPVSSGYKRIGRPEFQSFFENPEKGNQFGGSHLISPEVIGPLPHPGDLSIPTGAFRVPFVQSMQPRVRCGVLFLVPGTTYDEHGLVLEPRMPSVGCDSRWYGQDDPPFDHVAGICEQSDLC